MPLAAREGNRLAQTSEQTTQLERKLTKEFAYFGRKFYLARVPGRYAIRIPANDSREGPASGRQDGVSCRELFPRVGFIVTNLTLPSRTAVRFYNKRGTSEQWIKGSSRR